MKHSYVHVPTYTSAHLMFMNDKKAILTALQTNKNYRGGGGAKKVMAQICHDADREQVKIWLEVVPEFNGPMNEEDLIRFYKRYDFKSVRERPFLMIRKPVEPDE